MAIHKVSKLIVCGVLALGMAGITPVAGAAPLPPAGDNHSAAYMGVMVDNVSPELASSLHLKDSNGAVITGVD